MYIGDKYQREIIMEEIISQIQSFINSTWYFSSIYSNSMVEVDFKLINKVGAKFLNTISDFYFVESINFLDAFEKLSVLDISTISKIADNYNILLKLKLFYLVELDKCIKFVDANKIVLEQYFLDFPPVDSTSSILNYLISERVTYENVLEKILLLNFLYEIQFKGINRFYSDSYYFTEQEILTRYRDYLDYPLYNQNHFWTRLLQSAEEIVKAIDVELQYYENNFFKLTNVSDLNIFGSRYAIRTFGKIFKREVEKRNLSKYAYSKLSCYASMIIDNTNYITVNGCLDSQINKNSNLYKMISVLKALLANSSLSVKYIGISDQTQYHFGNASITYKQFIVEMEKLGKKCENKKDLNRMFTCCERKLIAHLDILGVSKVDIVTTKYPCYMCERTIKAKNKSRGFSIKVISAKYKERTSLNRKKFDSFAQFVYEAQKVRKKYKFMKKNSLNSPIFIKNVTQY